MSKATYIVWVGLIVLLLGTFLYMGYQTDKENAEYKKFEMDLEEAASIYVKKEGHTLKDGESLEIPVYTLLKGGYIDSDKVGDDTCSGTIYVTKGTKNYVYNAVISCDNYETNVE